jgi:hypothetical protein
MTALPPILSRRVSSRVLVGAATLALLGATASPAFAQGRTSAAGHSASASGYDISYPQCGGPFPATPTFGIVGVNDGVVHSTNPCLGTGDGPSELSWAESSGHPAFYANTADPGPAYSSFWPNGQTSPQTCDGTNTEACSYDYGWNMAAYSFAAAVTAEQELNATSPTASAASVPWWLDVETGNSWQTLESDYGNTPSSGSNDLAALSGASAYLANEGVASIGFYSTSTQWTEITGGTGQFQADPSWVAGFRSVKTAASGCSATGFTGGRIALTQYPAGGFDADYACP